MLQSQFNFVNIMIQPLDQGTNCVTVQTKPGQFIYSHLFKCTLHIVRYPARNMIVFQPLHPDKIQPVATDVARSVVCMFVCHTSQLCKNG